MVTGRHAALFPSQLSRAASIARKAFSFPVFLGALLVAGLFAALRLYLAGTSQLQAGSFAPVFAEGDTWWHLVVGERILTSGAWPTSDTYSVTAFGEPWIAYEWLGEVLMALVARRWALSGLTALLIVLLGLVLLLLYWHAWQRSGNAKAAFLGTALILPLLTAGLATLRPQLLGYVFLLVALICLENFRHGRTRAVWILPPMFLVWVNTHGSFVLGLFVMGLYWTSGLVGFRCGGVIAEPWTRTQRRQLLLVILASLMLLPLTPYGTRLAAYPLELMLFQPVATSSNGEFLPIDFSQWWGKLFIGLFLCLFLAQLLFQHTNRLQDVLLLIASFVAASLHVRFILFFAIASAPMFASLFARWVPAYQPAKDRPFLNAAVILLVLAGLVSFFPSPRDLKKMIRATYPQQAVDYLRGNPAAGAMLNEISWGGYLIWQLPEHKVFIDARSDLYEYAGVLSDYLRITRVESDAFFLLRKYNVQACLLPPKAPLATVLATLPDWQRVYSDALSVVFVRRGANQSVRTGCISVSP